MKNIVEYIDRGKRGNRGRRGNREVTNTANHDYHEPRLPRLFFTFPIRAYQYLLSPWLGTNCRFEPSCSHYALQSMEDHGAVKGGWLTVRRLLRCHPFAAAGYDPVPPTQK